MSDIPASESGTSPPKTPKTDASRPKRCQWDDAMVDALVQFVIKEKPFRKWVDWTS
jgi:hypothetical protein